ncbi:hypothetical protein AcetOrient_orf03646 [Acetobacter orientalis]|uniref:Uncharacterized protein n=1 Tax=Acetobacter orientalis TaxID=146474 RepID=A0A2Z5ZJ79_9PROT|nr:hypothetical protein AcetOrient_orf03646 [Acetobacter orientalis]
MALVYTKWAAGRNWRPVCGLARANFKVFFKGDFAALLRLHKT